MLYAYLLPFSEQLSALNVFRYITFRAGGAMMTALLISFIAGPIMIRLMACYQVGTQPIREDGPQGHLTDKQGTPTMGGMFILLSSILATILWADIGNAFVWLVLAVMLGFGMIGFLDDLFKIAKTSSRGLSGRMKLTMQGIIAIVCTYAITTQLPVHLQTTIAVPIFKDVLMNFGWFFIPFSMVVMIGASNAVNLTDGLDGLAIVPVMIVAGVFLIIAYLVGNSIFADYLQLHHVPGSGELAVFCSALIGSGLGFLWYNAPPAKIFMGDTGSLSLGGALGTVSIITKHELVLAIAGGLFVMETVSVIVQVVSFKLTGKRVFRMAPLHHHFERKGWAESTIVIRFWIIATILALIGLSTLKLR